MIFMKYKEWLESSMIRKMEALDSRSYEEECMRLEEKDELDRIKKELDREKKKEYIFK